MTSKTRDTIQRVLAIIIIIAMLAVMGIPFSVIVFFGIVTFFIWRAVSHTEHQETGRIFEFYIAASDVLCDEERPWFGFEIRDVIDRGERVLLSMSDPPPLIYYALGALYYKSGDHHAAAEHLSYIVENDLSDERHTHAPSTELRRYVHILRKLEREPAVAPQTIAAIRNLERARHHRAAYMLAECRERIELVSSVGEGSRSDLGFDRDGFGRAEQTDYTLRPSMLAPPRPITEVLHDVYDEEKKTA